MTDTMLGNIYNVDCIAGMRRMYSKFGQCVDLILTDIPYGNVTKNGEERAQYSGQMRSLDKRDADIETFNLTDFLDLCYKLSKGSVYIFCGIEQLSTVFSYFDSKQDISTRQCIWHKTNPSPVNGQHYWIHAIENCVYAKRRKTTFNQHCKHNVWDFPVGRSKIHPTEKPLKLFEYLIESSSNVGDIIFDPCIGSGTAAVAAQNLGRQFIGFDINSEYCNLAINRVKNYEKEAK